MAQKHVYKRAETLQILNPDEFNKFLIQEELTTSQVQYPSTESFAGLQEGFTDIDPFQPIEQVSFATKISSGPGGCLEAYFLRLSKEWHSIPAGFECPFRPEWRAHSIPDGME